MEASTFLRAGHRAWDALERDKRSARRRSRDTSVEELLRAGQRLSAQAAALRRAVESGDRPARP